MKTKYSSRLDAMRARRLMPFSVLDSGSSVLKFSSIRERYEERSPHEAVQYCLGAMEALSPEHTRVCMNEVSRVQNQLASGLEERGLTVEFELQGSVPLDIHIEFSSDIDLLVIYGDVLRFEPRGVGAGNYVKRPKVDWVDMLWNLREHCHGILKSKYPAATVNNNGSKAIAVSGGSLRRKIDVVPAYWYDTAAYQMSRARPDRCVSILDITTFVVRENFPFKHMEQIEAKDKRTRGGARKVIRLLKNLKRDCGVEIALSSYDLAAIVWNIPDLCFYAEDGKELSLVLMIRDYLRELSLGGLIQQVMRTPDNTRVVFDSPAKLQGVFTLLGELDALITDIGQQLNTRFAYMPEFAPQYLREAVIL